MRPIPMAAPLFIVREACQKDLPGVLRRLKEIGFDGVELVGFFGHSPQQIREMTQNSGLLAIGNHVPYAEFLSSRRDVIDAHAEIGCRYITVAELPMEDFPSVAAELEAIAEDMRSKGMRLLYHNHDHELREKVKGQEALRFILDNTSPESLAFEPDLGWIEIGGGDAHAYLARYGSRCPVIHLKDYYAESPGKIGRVLDFTPARGGPEHGYFEFRPTGYGVMNYSALLPLCLACRPEWFVIDHDLAYERNSFDDLRLSLEYVRALMRIQQNV